MAEDYIHNPEKSGRQKKAQKAFPGHVYVHVPFCSGKCLYCAFYSESHNIITARKYFGALRNEILATRQKASPDVQTIYFGGGTPSILSCAELTDLCSIVTAEFSTKRLKEWTIEGNPGTFSQDKLEVLRTAGVNRVSIGAQSFDNSTLNFLGRRHNADEIGRTFDCIRGSGITNVGLDLIAAIPGVSIAAWKSSLRKAVELEPAHISVYCLSVEEDSKLNTLVSTGALKLPGQAAQLHALKIAQDMLEDRGYVRYEISNYARPGKECLHNLSTWRGGDYIGFGPAAASRVGLSRWTNAPDLKDYTSSVSTKKKVTRSEEDTLSPETDALERIAFAFRLREGVCLEDFSAIAGADLTESCRHILQQLALNGLVTRHGRRWCPTPKGFDMADTIAAELLAAE